MSRDKRTYYVSLLSLVLLIVLVYYPSLSHLLRGEMYVYLLDTNKNTSVGDLIGHWYNYEILRTYSPGDTLLARPLLWIVVATEKGLFGFNYVWWNIVSLMSHILASLSLYQLLWTIKKGVLALVLAASFSVSFLLMNTVLYQEITGYMLFTALILLAIRWLWQGIQEESPLKLSGAVLCVLVASFLYEVGSLFAVVMAGYAIFQSRKWRKPIVGGFFCVPILYSIVYIINKSPMASHLSLGEFLNWDTIVFAISSFGQIILFWLQEVVLPAIYSISVTPILQYNPVALETEMPLIKYPLIFLNLTAVVIIGLALLKRDGKAHSLLLYMVSFMLLMHIFVVSFFRAWSRGLTYILSTNFTAYMVLAWFIVLLYLVLADAPLTSVRYKAVVCALVGLLLVNGYMVYAANSEIASIEYANKTFLGRLGDFVAVHQAESNFTFCVKGLPQELRVDTFREGQATGSLHFTVPQILYADYWNDSSPKYTIEYGELVK